MSRNAQLLIWGLVEQAKDSAHRRWIDAKCSLAACQAGHVEWDKANPDDGVGSMGSNPYNVTKAADHLEAVEQRYLNLREASEFAVKTFLGEEVEECDSTS